LQLQKEPQRAKKEKIAPRHHQKKEGKKTKIASMRKSRRVKKRKKRNSGLT